MTFKHKLARRLALLKDRGLITAVAVLAAAAVVNCERPLSTTDPITSVARVVISPHSVTLQPNELADFTAASFTAAGDSSPVGILWHATSGVVSDTGTTGHRHYGRYKNASCGDYLLIASNSPGWRSDSAKVAVRCPVAVASVAVSPASVALQVGQTVQLAATPQDTGGNPLAGRVVTWASNNAAVAPVTASGLATAVAVGSATITATSEGKTGTAAVAVASVPVASVAVTPASATVQAGQTVQLAATPKDANGNPLSGRAIGWSSNNLSVANVNASGLVTGVAPGSATITAASEGKSGAAVITVNPAPVPVASVGVTPGSATMQAGQTVQLAATPKDVNGNPLSGRVVTWASSTPAVATVNASGLVTSVAAGSATITATSEGQSGTALISVTAAPVASVAVTPAAVGLQPGGTVQLTATPKDANGNPLTGRGVVWTSSTGAVATVGSSGLVTAVATGAATITATSEGQSGSSSITVSNAPVASVAVTPAAASVQVGQTMQLAATPKDANGNPLSGRIISWSSSNTSVVGVNSSGLVTAVATGGATITATSEGQSGTASITVPPVPVATVAVTPASASVDEGKTVQLTATPKDAAGNPLSGRVVTWTSSNTAAATVNSSGLVTAKLAGAATITATSEGQSGTSAITVVHVAVASVAVAPASASVNEGQTVQLTATLKDASGNTLTGRTVTWASSNTAAATVSSSGLVTGKVAGAATITATSETVSGTSAITVVHVPVAAVAVTPASASLPAGQTVQLTATLKDANGNTLTGRTVTWASSNTAAATVTGSGLVSGVTAGTATITATSETVSGTAAVTVTAASAGGQFGHVFVVTEENTDYADVTTSSMPYLMGLAAQYGLATQYYANTHPSIGNYFELATGQILTNNDGSSTIENVPNVVRSLVAAGKTWKSYAESIPNACYLGGDTGDYARKHNVFALLSDVANDPSGQACNIVPFTQFATDLANGRLPSFSNIVPNLCNDAHDCGLDVADSWLQTNIAPLIASPVFQQDGLLIIVFDEAGGDNTNGGGRIVWVAVSPKAKRGYQSTTLYQHQSTLRLILKGLGVNVFPGAAASAPDMSEFFTP